MTRLTGFHYLTEFFEIEPPVTLIEGMPTETVGDLAAHAYFSVTGDTHVDAASGFPVLANGVNTNIKEAVEKFHDPAPNNHGMSHLLRQTINDQFLLHLVSKPHHPW